ncbi:MAG: SAM-dependent methyltransferase [Bacteroidetes bacterium]|nr:SAM-dependent methyltransferase [Bacteroidota bacterium]
MQQTTIHHPASYRDPSGFIFTHEGEIYRCINQSFQEHFEHFINSGCYAAFVQKGWLINHDEINGNDFAFPGQYRIIKPQQIPFISYPYEWGFDMLKDAALLTLTLAKEALQYGLILKDATPYNIQWLNGKLIFIDSLSFEKYDPSQPWIAYRQFCECFLSPLLLMHYSQQPLQPMLLAWPDGIPLVITQSLLPKKSRFSLHTYLHIHLHSKVASGKNKESKEVGFSQKKLENLLNSLETLVKSLQLKSKASTWSHYYEEAAGRKNYIDQKKKIIENWLTGYLAIHTAVDIGANDGEFAKLLSAKNISVIATDFDPYCISNLYTSIRQSGEKNILPLVLDAANPSPAIGVNNKERDSFIKRTRTDLVLALAVIHHLAIGKNIPFTSIAESFQQLGTYLIIEFVPKEDEKIQLMLQHKKDIYTDYSEKYFIESFENYFSILKREPVANSGRVLFLMQHKHAAI